MTPKMATDKVNAPAVSQLAGEIAAEQVFANYFEALKKSYGAEHKFSGLTLWTVAKEVRDIFSAALSEREEKVAKLVEAATVTIQHFERNSVSGNFQGDDEHECWNLLAAALSALGE